MYFHTDDDGDPEYHNEVNSNLSNTSVMTRQNFCLLITHELNNREILIFFCSDRLLIPEHVSVGTQIIRM